MDVFIAALYISLFFFSLAGLAVGVALAAVITTKRKTEGKNEKSSREEYIPDDINNSYNEYESLELNQRINSNDRAVSQVEFECETAEKEEKDIIAQKQKQEESSYRVLGRRKTQNNKLASIKAKETEEEIVTT
jgi:hypothetical protein